MNIFKQTSTLLIVLSTTAYTLLFPIVFASNAYALGSITFTIYYDPLNNTGIMVVTLQLIRPAGLEPPYEITIPVNVFGEESMLYLINYTVSGIKSITLEYDNNEGSINAIYDSAGTLEVYFTVENMITQLGEESFELYIDSTKIAQLTKNFQARIILPGLYDVTNTSLQGSISLSINRDTVHNITQVDLSGIGELILILILESPLEQEIMTRPRAEPFNVLYIVIPVIAIVAVAIALGLMRRRTREFEVEKVDIAQDDATKAIIRLLKESGNRGLTQAEIVKHTGLPKSSVSRRIRRLEEEGYVEVRRAGKFNYVYLTDKGLEYAKKIISKDKSA